MDPVDEFPAAACRELAFVVEEFGFRIAESGREVVRFESPSVVVIASFYDGEGGQLDVTAQRANETDRHASLILGGMVGRASVARVLQIAAEKLRANEPALQGDESYYRRLGEERRRESEAWMAYYAGKGPRPATGRLP
jgi:hypothetical protein